MKHSDFISLPQFVKVIQQLVAKKSTGTCFLGTPQNAFAQIAYQNGQISFVTFAGQRGQKALEMIAKEKSVRYNFNTQVLSASTDALPRTEDVYTILLGGDITSRPPVKHSGVDMLLTQKHLRLITDVLARYIGPVAAIICNEHNQSQKTVGMLLQALSGEIDSAAEADRFQKEVLSLL